MAAREIPSEAAVTGSTSGRPTGGWPKINTFVSVKIATDQSHIVLIAAHALDIGTAVHGRLPRIVDKLVLSFSKHLEPEITFDTVSAKILEAFLQRQHKPLCLISHGGSEHEFPVMQRAIGAFDSPASWQKDVYFADTKVEGSNQNNVEARAKRPRLDINVEGLGDGLGCNTVGCISAEEEAARLIISVMEEKISIVPSISLTYLRFHNGGQFSDNVVSEARATGSIATTGAATATGKTRTFIFLDIETTGLGQRSDITELCMVALDAETLMSSCKTCPGEWKDQTSLLDGVDKLRILVSPRQHVSQGAAKISGLTDEALSRRHRAIWNKETDALIRDFLSRQNQPLCLVAHNGNRFDFPIIRRHIDQAFLSTWFSEFYKSDSIRGFNALAKNGSVQYKSYGLDKLFSELVGSSVIPERHTAEGDTLALIEVVRSFPYNIAAWLDENKGPLVEGLAP